MNDQTDEELCAMVAEEQGWVRTKETPRDNIPCRAGGTVWWVEADGTTTDGHCDECMGPPTGNPINDREDFGALWNQAIRRYLVAIYPGSDGISRLVLYDKRDQHSKGSVREFWSEFDNDGDLRRALVLAFLKARGRIQ